MQHEQRELCVTVHQVPGIVLSANLCAWTARGQARLGENKSIRGRAVVVSDEGQPWEVAHLQNRFSGRGRNVHAQD